MSYAIQFVTSAEREFLRLPQKERERIGAKIDSLAENPRQPGSTKLSAQGNLWRIRSGSYRVVYSIDDANSIIFVTRVAHRREVYRGL